MRVHYYRQCLTIGVWGYSNADGGEIRSSPVVYHNTGVLVVMAIMRSRGIGYRCARALPEALCHQWHACFKGCDMRWKAITAPCALVGPFSEDVSNLASGATVDEASCDEMTDSIRGCDAVPLR